MKQTKKSNNKKQALITIVALLLAIAVVMGSLAAFTDVFKKGGNDKLEYKALANGDEVSTLYFNTDYVIKFDDYIKSTICEHVSLKSNEDIYSLMTFKADTKSISVGFVPSEIYGMYMIKVSLYDLGFNEIKVKYLYCSVELESEDMKISKGWNVDSIDLCDFADVEKVTVDSEYLLSQEFSGKFISANGAFIAEV